MTAFIAFALPARSGSSGYYGYWRFSETRSVQGATSDRCPLGGLQLTRCSISTRS